ncbi:hypothetical protein HYH03_019180 [Edaphochlamys debaryana]|uniref:Peptidase C1A papain C-terminal domain-containing protein n=1 Tax=Edaphochlamys debaryana TaxID=47281 RepID=A0A836BM90_9CHLO|nr:hypothetical protein HYH03_019180 [Edaphochlamys debaryana]|eukprot:KAG2481856.1 hypothetical protein HYH03_019180 [Edaphochlamys debaryana]
MSPRARWALASVLVLLACGLAQAKTVPQAEEAAVPTPGIDAGKAQQGAELVAHMLEDADGDNGDEPLCSDTVDAAKRTGLGSCQQQAPAATRAAAAAADGGAGLGPDDASRYMSIDEAKAAALKQLQEAKANPLAAFAKWLADNKKGYTADSEEGKRVFARFLEVIESGIKHNSDPATLYAVSAAPPGRFTLHSMSPHLLLRPSYSLIDNRNTLNAAQNTGSKCFADWAFAVTAAMQAQSYLSTGTLLPNLSNQQLVDCAVTSSSYGGVMAESDYPYEMSSYRPFTDSPRKTCRASSKTSSKRYTISGFNYLNHDEEEMRMLPFAIVGYGSATVSGQERAVLAGPRAWGSSWGGLVVPGHFRIKRGAGLAGITFNPLTIKSVSLKSSASKCTTSTAWTPGVYSAWKKTIYNKYWSVAATGACNQYGYSYNAADKASAEKSALDACTAGFKVPCAIMRSGQATCTNATRIADLKAWVEAKAQPGQIYAVAINGTCGTGYGRWSSSDWSYVNDVVKDCNADMLAKYGTSASPACGIILSGKKPAAVTKCTDSSKWQTSRTAAISNTYWGYSWAVTTDPRCGNQWYTYNQPTLDAAKNYYPDKCNAAAAPTFGANACSVVDFGTAQCTDSTTWQNALVLAKDKTSSGKYWAVFSDKLCTYRWYSYNYASEDAVKAATGLTTCNNNATARGLSAYSCGIVAYGKKW